MQENALQSKPTKQTHYATKLSNPPPQSPIPRSPHRQLSSSLTSLIRLIHRIIPKHLHIIHILRHIRRNLLHNFNLRLSLLTILVRRPRTRRDQPTSIRKSHTPRCTITSAFTPTSLTKGGRSRVGSILQESTVYRGQPSRRS